MQQLLGYAEVGGKLAEVKTQTGTGHQRGRADKAGVVLVAVVLECLFQRRFKAGGQPGIQGQTEPLGAIGGILDAQRIASQRRLVDCQVDQVVTRYHVFRLGEAAQVYPGVFEKGAVEANLSPLGQQR